MHPPRVAGRSSTELTVHSAALPQRRDAHHGLCCCTPDLHVLHCALCTLLKPTLASQCRYNASSPGSHTLLAHSHRRIIGPSERLTATPARHNMVGATPRPCPVSTDVYTRGTRLALCAPPSASSSRAGSACGIRPACYHPEGFYTGARSPWGGGGGLGGAWVGEGGSRLSDLGGGHVPKAKRW